MTRVLSRAGVLLAAALLPGAMPAAAQEWQVVRDYFAFAGSSLEIRVDAESAGRLRIVRGPSGNVAVAGRTAAGFTTAGLTADDRLTLSALASGPVDFMVTVPDRVWITVRLPDRHLLESVGAHASGGSFAWQGAGGEEQAWPGDAPAPGDAEGDPAPDPTGTDLLPSTPDAAGPGVDRPLFTTFVADGAPAEVSLPDLRNVRSVSVRVEGDRFRIESSRPLALKPGNPALVEIRPAGPPLDLVVVLPAWTTDFTLRAAGHTAARLTGAGLDARCTPATRQWLSDGRAWVTFTPADGVLRCGPRAGPRHEG